MKTGIKELDEIMKIKDNDLIVIAARPTMGKTRLAIRILINILKETEKSVLLFNLDESKEKCKKRIVDVCLDYKVKIEEDYDTFVICDEKTESNELIVDNKQEITISEIESRIEKINKKRKLGLIVMDYLQLIRYDKQSDNRKLEIKQIGKKLKRISEKINVPIIVSSQISRKPDLRDNHRPVIEDFEESASIVDLSDKIVLIYRESYYDKKIHDKYITELIVSKNKAGKTRKM